MARTEEHALEDNTNKLSHGGEDASAKVSSPKTPSVHEELFEPSGFLEQPQPPVLVGSTPNSLTLSWKPSSVVGVREDVDADALNGNLLYQLEYQKLGAIADKGSVVVNHAAWERLNLQATTIMLEELEVGTSYAFRLRVQLWGTDACSDDAPPGNAQFRTPQQRPPCRPSGNTQCGSIQQCSRYSHEVNPSAPSVIVTFRTAMRAPGAPHPPALLSRRRNALTLRWAAPIDTGGDPITGYVLICRPPIHESLARPSTVDSENPGWEQIHTGPDTELMIPGLRPAQKYEFKLQACNSLGGGPWSASVAHSTSSAAPGCPASVRATSTTMSSVSLEWSDAVSNGASITAYRLEYGREEAGPFDSCREQLQTSCTVTGLQSGRQYWFRVQAHNQRGPGPWSKAVAASTVAAPPSPPQFVRVKDVDRTSATIMWQPPAQQHGMRTLQYRVDLQARSSYAKEHFSQSLTGSDEWLEVYKDAGEGCVLSDLQPGCHYAVRIQAVSEAGPGIWCNPIDIHTMPGTPMPCEKLTILHAGQRSIEVRWMTPRHNGGSRILQYDVDCAWNDPNASPPTSQPSPHEGHRVELRQPVPYPWNTWTVDVVDKRSTSATHNITELTPGRTYVIRVRARNREGNSLWSDLVEATTSAAVPSTPEPVMWQASTSSSLKLSWQVPDANGSPITSFSLSYKPCAAVASHSPGSSGGLSHLQASAATGGGSTPMRSGGDSSPSHIDLLHSGGAGTGTGTDRQQLAHSRSSRTLSVAGSTGALSGDLKDDTSCGSMQGIGMAAVLDCLAASQQNCWQSILCPATCTEATITDLSPHTTYAIRLSAENAVGMSHPSPVMHYATMAARPGPVSDVTIHASSSTHVDLCWAPTLEDNGSPITAYQVEHATAPRGVGTDKAAPKAWVRSFQGLATACRVDSLTPGKQYLFRVRCCNVKGFGAWSAALPGTTTPAPPGECGAITFSQRSSTRVRIKWGSCTRENGSPILAYRLEMSDADADGGFALAFQGKELAHRVGGLAPGREYAFRVCAVSNAGCGPWSDAAAVTTLLNPPAAPLRVLARALECADDRLELSVAWERPAPAASDAEVASYEVEATEARERSTPRTSRLAATTKAPSCSCTLAGAYYETIYAVRVRCIGAAGAGHSPWSETSFVTTPALIRRLPESPEPSDGSDDAVPASPGLAGLRPVRVAAAAAAAVGCSTTAMPTARAPPRTRWLRSRRFQRKLWRAAAAALALAALTLLVYIALGDSKGADTRPAAARRVPHGAPGYQHQLHVQAHAQMRKHAGARQ